MTPAAKRQANRRARQRATGLVLIQVWVHPEDRDWLRRTAKQLARTRLKTSDPV